MGEQSPCFFSGFCSTPCHKASFLYNGSSKLIPVMILSPEDQEILRRRTGANVAEDALICSCHHALLITKFVFLQRTCCNPFDKDKCIKKKGLQPITIATADELQELTKRPFQPGQKMCPRCRGELRNRRCIRLVECKKDEFEGGIYPVEATTKANDSLASLGEHSLRLSRTGKRKTVGYLKRKVERAKIGISNATATPAGINSAEAIGKETVENCHKSRDLDILTEDAEVKRRNSDHGTQLQILTLAPSNCTMEDRAKEFDSSTRMVKQARKLKMEAGILAVPQKGKGTTLREEIKKKVLVFYENYEFSWMCPGGKDLVSVRIDGERVHKQKRLLLCNLKEMYVAYVNCYGNEIGFSKFCELRPKWCITVAARGAHSISVCTIHQNVKLMLSAIPIRETYKSLIEKTVCNMESQQCMLRKCEDCPGKTQLKSYLADIFKEYDQEEIVEFKQWIQTDTGTLCARSASVEGFIEELTLKIFTLKTHHFISKNQSQYLRKLKESNRRKEVIVLMDFSENYPFLVQDAFQAFHWNKMQATIHPIIVYIPGPTLQFLSICIISDCLIHDVVSVYAFQIRLIEHLKVILGHVTAIHYFSDDSAAQYKNYKNFINLCFHKEDFGIPAEWNFFGTGHGKSACDGIAGTVKRLAARASLQRPLQNQILTPRELFKFCDANILGIKFFFVSSEDIKALQGSQEKRFSTMDRTLPGTREYDKYNRFKPISKDEIQIFRFSGDETSQIIKLY